MQCSKIQTWQQTQGGFKIKDYGRKGLLLLVPFLIALLIPPFFGHGSYGAEKKQKKQPPAPKLEASKAPEITGANLQAYYKDAEEMAKKGKVDGALRMFLNVHAYAKDLLSLMQSAQTRYEKAGTDASLSQSQKEDFYIKLQRIRSLTAQYSLLEAESAYNIGSLYTKKGEYESARKYLLEACKKLPFSPEPNSSWMKSKNLLLGLFRLEGEF
jgi:tetratricopeptide (TPR) repeat protein